MEGKVKFFNTDKGYGFIVGEDEKEYFYHISDFKERIETVEKEASVTFDITPSQRNPDKMKAVNIELI